MNRILIFIGVTLLFSFCQSEKQVEEIKESTEIIKLMTLDPGHFHAALVQKIMFDNVDSTVYVFAPEGKDVEQHLSRIKGFNSRESEPTSWNEEIYIGPDYFERMLKEQPGNVMVVSGNNAKKADYILKTINLGINVLADKPMVISPDEFSKLEEAFKLAEENKVLLYDIMTERHEITTILQKELSQISDIFGALLSGSVEQPSITKESIHHFFKYVSGNPLIRPAWFFDVEQQGEGIVDVTTHLVDMVQWECFPDQVIDYKNEIEIISAKRWTTDLSLKQFKKVTGLNTYPDYLVKDVDGDILKVYSNGEIVYKIKGVVAKVSVIWNYQAPKGTGDTHYSIMRGSNCDLVIKQGKTEGYKPVLYVEPKGDTTSFNEKIKQTIVVDLQSKYPGIAVEKVGDNLWKINIPDLFKEGHEAHFSQVTEKFLDYLQNNNMPAWEVPNMLAKYYTTTEALKLAKSNGQNTQ